MNQIDRLIEKAKRLSLGGGDVFVISGESGIWKVGNCEFPDFESAEGYIDALIGSLDEKTTVIINDLTPELLKETEKQIKESDRKRDREENRRIQRQERKRKKQDEKRRLQKQEQMKKERLKRQECLERERLEQKQMEMEQLLKVDKDRQLI